MILKEIEVTIKYRAGIGEIDVPDEVLAQLKTAYENSHEVTDDRYPEAHQWLCDNIKEKDAMEWIPEIDFLRDES